LEHSPVARYVVSYLQASKETNGQKGLRKGLCANNYTDRKVRGLGEGPRQNLPWTKVYAKFWSVIFGASNGKDFVMHFFLPKGRGTERGHPHYIRLKLHDLAQLFQLDGPFSLY